MCYEAGDIDITAVGSGLAELTDGDPDLHVFPKASVSYIVENSRDCPELHNKNIRMAITKSLDRNNLAENVIRTGSFPMTRVNPPNFYKETDGTDFSEDAGRYEKYCSYDPADAAALWEQGLNELGVSEITLNFVYSSSLGNVVEALAAQMKEALPGLELELTPLPFKEMLQRKSKGEYDLLLSGWIADYVDPTSFLGLFISTFDFGYGNPEYDELYSQIQSARYAQSPDERNELMHEAEDMLMEDAAVIPLYMNGNSYLIDKEVNGFVLSPTGDSWVITSLTKEVK
jgi:oligopeptide transport system substrate-binding protein